MAQSQAILDCTTAKKQHGAQLPETFKNQEEEEGEEEEEEEEEPTRVRGPKRLVCHIVPHAAP